MISPHVSRETENSTGFFHLGERVERISNDEPCDRPRCKSRHHVGRWQDHQLHGLAGLRRITLQDRLETVRREDLLQDHIVNAPPERHRNCFAGEVSDGRDLLRHGECRAVGVVPCNDLQGQTGSEPELHGEWHQHVHHVDRPGLQRLGEIWPRAQQRRRSGCEALIGEQTRRVCHQQWRCIGDGEIPHFQVAERRGSGSRGRVGRRFSSATGRQERCSSGEHETRPGHQLQEITAVTTVSHCCLLSVDLYVQPTPAASR